MGTNRFSALYRFRALFGGDGKKRYIGTPLYITVRGKGGSKKDRTGNRSSKKGGLANWCF